MRVKFLVIDHSAPERILVSGALVREGYEVTATASVEEALNAAQTTRSRVDVIVLSSETQAVSGDRLWSRAQEAFSGIPIIALGMEAGFPAAISLPRPVDNARLIEQARKLMDGTRMPDEQGDMPTMKTRATREVVLEEPVAQAVGVQVSQEAAAEGDAAMSRPLEMTATAGGRGGDDDSPDEVRPGGLGDAGQEVLESLQNLLDSGLSELREERAAEAAANQPVTPPGEAPPSAPSPNLPEQLAGLPIERVEEIVSDIAREVVERVVWETVPAMVLKVVNEKQAEQDQLFIEVVERVVWETLPDVATSIVKDEIARLTSEDG